MFTCWLFLCLFILFRLLCLGWTFCILALCGSSLFWLFLTVDGAGGVACQGFLVRETCVGVLMGGAAFLLWSAMKCPAVNFEMSMGLVWLWAVCILKLRLHSCIAGMSHSGTYWSLGGAWFQCRYGVFWMSFYQLMFPRVRSSLVFSGFGLNPPPSGFQSYSYSSLKTSPTIQNQL